MAVCPICGCKTEELDFVARKISNQDCKVCSFCDRQLNVFDSSDEPNDAQLRWLSAVIMKDVPERDASVVSALKDIRSNYGDKEVEQSATPVQQRANVVHHNISKKSSTNASESDLIAELQDRITALENEMRSLKRRQMIKTIVELGAPFVLLIVLIIVVLSSGIIDNFKSILDMGGIAF